MNPNKSNRCQNCQCTLQEDEVYCSVCGQKQALPPLSVRYLIGDFFQSLFSFDSKLPRTIIPLLFKPGALTIEYLNGKRRKYFSPIKMFLFLLTIGLILTTLAEPDAIELKVLDGGRLNQQQFHSQKYADSIQHDLHQVFTDTPILSKIDTVFEARKDNSIENDSIKVILFFEEVIEISVDDILTYEFDTLTQKYHIENFWDRLLTKQIIKSSISANALVKYTVSHISWAIFMLLPLLGLWLKLLYIRKKKYFVEHLIFLFHLQSLLLLVLILDFGVYQIIGYGSLIVLLSIIFFILYTWAAIHKVYQQGWFKTTLKWLLFFSGYFLLGIITFILLSLISFLLF